MKLFADIFLWLAAAAAPLAHAAPFALRARHRTPAKIATAICSSSWVTTLAAFAAWRLR